MAATASSACTVELAALGTQEAASFSELIEQEIPFLRRIVRFWHRQRADADDLVQDTIVRALANAHLWEPGSNLRAWLWTIMRNQFLGTLARSTRALHAHSAHAAVRPAVTAHESDGRLALRDLQKALHRLPERQQIAVIKVGIEGYSYADVAKVAGTSVDGIRCDLARARIHLRAAIDRAGEPTPLPARPPRQENAAARRANPNFA
ncbi:MAG TPA: RNA polymerase sigma factor [Stellaceae bacterium]|nr:RNA polymerase sigma factor [Stellaceae bacterium]